MAEERYADFDTEDSIDVKQFLTKCFHYWYLFVIVLVVAFRSGWRLWKAGKEGFEKGLGLGFMGCVLACASTNLFGDRWSYVEMGSYFWVFWGLVDRGILMAQKTSPPAPNIEQAE